MKMNLISALAIATCLHLAVAKETLPVAKSDKLPKNWNSDSRAVYDLLVAQFQHAGADYAGSVDTLVKFAKAQKDDKLYAKAFKALLQTERYADAVELTADWQKQSSLDINQFYVLSLALNHDIDLAINDIDTAIEKKIPDSDNSSATERLLFPYIQLLLSHWYKPEVTALLARLYEQYPDSELVSSTYAQQLRWQGDIEGAIAIIDKRRFDDQRNIELVQQKSDIYRYAVQLEAAEKVWTDLLADYPNEPLFRFAYARFLFDKYDFSGAIKQLSTLKSGELDNSGELLKIMALIHQEKYNDAEAAFETHFANSEEQARVRYSMAEQLLQQKNYALAKKYLEPLVDFTADNDGEWALPAALQIAWVLYAIAEANDLSAGDAWFDQLAAHFHLNPEEKLRENANALDKAGHENVAYDRLNAFLAENPNHEEIRYTRGLIGADMQLNARAIEDLKVIHAASPDNIDVQNALGYTLLGQDKTLDEGAQLVQKALFSKPSSPAVVDSMGWVKYRRGQFDAALPYLRYAYGNYLDGEIIGHYIMALYQAGKPELAKKLYQLEIQYSPNVKKINRHVEDILAKLKD